MAKIVESVPNFSEGKDKAKIERIISVFSKHPNIKLLSYEPDSDYNRTVVTLIGEPEPMIQALLEFIGVVSQEIDLNFHHGEHPRMGAVDVIPFVPIEEVTLKDCVEYAKRLAQLANEKYDIPVFLYAEAASAPERIMLPDIRKSEFEGMKEKIKDPIWHPDYGKPEIHPTFGVVAIGARHPLIAYNIDLDTADEKIANSIAKAIRKSSGGFQYIQAGSAYLEKRGHVQVTMNILDYKKNPIYRIFETVKMEAKRYQITVTGAEIVGLVPKDALVKSLEYYFSVFFIPLSFKEIDVDTLVEKATKYLMLRDFDKYKIIEFNL